MPRVTHGMSTAPVYKRWLYMKTRCAKDPKYVLKGIKVCERWIDSFTNFYSDMGDPPPGTTLDRIDGTRGYSPDNCRWASYKEQCRNLVTNVRVNGELLGEIAERSGVTRSTVAYRKRKGIQLDAPPINTRSTCKKGHPWSDENTYTATVKRKQGGTRLQRYCRKCRAITQKERRTNTATGAEQIC